MVSLNTHIIGGTCALLGLVSSPFIYQQMIEGPRIREHQQACAITENTTPLEVKVSRYPVEQVFRDHGGYRVYFTASDGLIQEETYAENQCWSDLSAMPIHIARYYAENRIIGGTQFKGLAEHRCVAIYRDLPPQTPGRAAILEFKLAGCGRRPRSDEQTQRYVEIHLPQDQSLSPGIHRYNAGDQKNPRWVDQSMQEIK